MGLGLQIALLSVGAIGTIASIAAPKRLERKSELLAAFGTMLAIGLLLTVLSYVNKAPSVGPRIELEAEGLFWSDRFSAASWNIYVRNTGDRPAVGPTWGWYGGIFPGERDRTQLNNAFDKASQYPAAPDPKSKDEIKPNGSRFYSVIQPMTHRKYAAFTNARTGEAAYLLVEYRYIDPKTGKEVDSQLCRYMQFNEPHHCQYHNRMVTQQ